MICWYVVIERIYLLKFEEEREGVYLKFRSLFEEPIGGLSSPQGLPRMSIPIAIIMSSWFWLWAKNEHYWFRTSEFGGTMVNLTRFLRMKIWPLHGLFAHPLGVINKSRGFGQRMNTTGFKLRHNGQFDEIFTSKKCKTLDGAMCNWLWIERQTL